MSNTNRSFEAKKFDFERKLAELKICYQRMHHIDDYTFKLSSLFYAINSVLLVASISFISTANRLELTLVIAFLGYFASAAAMLIEGKFQLFAWFVFLKRAKAIESEIDFELNEVYAKELGKSRWRFIGQGRVTYVFKSGIALLWVFLILFIAWGRIFVFLVAIAMLVIPWIILIGASIGYGKQGHQA